MIDFHCDCGAPIRMPDSAAGRRATCTTCGQKVTIPIPALQSALADEPDFALEPEEPRPVTRAHAPMRQSPPPGAEKPTSLSRARFEDAIASRKKRSYWSDALRSFAAPMTPIGASSIVGIVVLIALASVAPGIIGFIAQLIVYALIFAYCFEVIVVTANGDDDMPAPAGIDEWRDELPRAFFGMILTFLFVGVFPLLGFLGATFAGADERTIVIATACGGVFGVLLMPVALMAVALGGVTTLFRVDLLVRTVVSAPLQYLAIWIMLLLVFSVQVGLYTILLSASPPTGFFAVLLTWFVANLIFVYTLIVSMRQIGLFYRHFSDRFPWSAG